MSKINSWVTITNHKAHKLTKNAQKGENGMKPNMKSRLFEGYWCYHQNLLGGRRCICSCARDTTMILRLINYPNFRAIVGLARDPLYRTSFFMAFSSIFNAGCGFFFWIIAARIYTIEQVGLATALISSLGLVLLFSRLGLDFSIIRFFPTGDKNKIQHCLIITTLAILLAGLAYILQNDHLAPTLAFLKEPCY